MIARRAAVAIEERHEAGERSIRIREAAEIGAQRAVAVRLLMRVRHAQGAIAPRDGFDVAGEAVAVAVGGVAQNSHHGRGEAVKVGRQIRERVARIRRDLRQIVETRGDRARAERVELSLEWNVDGRILTTDAHGAVRRRGADPRLAIEDRIRNSERPVVRTEAVFQIEQNPDAVADVFCAAQPHARAAIGAGIHSRDIACARIRDFDAGVERAVERDRRLRVRDRKVRAERGRERGARREG